MDGKRPVVACLQGLVVASHPAAAQAGVRLMMAGGNAFDAAAASAAALSVVLPHACGPAGFGVALCWLAEEKRVRVLEFLPHRPVGGKGVAARVGVPAAAGGWCALAQAHGKRRLSEIFAPAATLARDGVVLIDGPAAALAVGPTAALAVGPATALTAGRDLLEPLGAALHGPGAPDPAPGQILRLPELARTLEQLGAEGPEWMTRGVLARALVEFVTAQGGTLALPDLASLGPVWSDPVHTPWRDLVVYAPPPPSQGFAALLGLRLEEGDTPATLAAALLRAEAARAREPQPGPAALKRLLDEETIAALRAADLPEIAPPSAPPSASLVAADREGNVVVLAQSLGAAFGTRLAVPGTGLLLGDALGWGAPREEAPEPAIALAPLLAVRNGAPVLALAGEGAAQVLRAWVHGMALPEAVAAPRLVLATGRAVRAEAGIDLTVFAETGLSATAMAAASAPDVAGAPDVVALARDPASGVLLAGADARGENDAATA